MDWELVLDRVKNIYSEEIGENGSAAFVITDSLGKEIISFGEERAYHAASLIKVPIMTCALKQSEMGILDMDRRVKLSGEDIVGGCGVLMLMDEGHELSVLELIKLMICVSDNTATNMLIDLVGIDNVNQMAKELDLKHTHLARKLMVGDFSKYSKTSPFDMIRLYKEYLGGGYLSDSSKILGLSILKEQQYNDRLSKGWEEELLFAHKTGEVTGVVHDSGIVLHEGSTYIMAGLCDKLAQNDMGYNFLNRVGSVVFEIIKGLEENGGIRC